MKLKKIMLKDILFILSALLAAFIMYKQTFFTPIQIFLGLLGVIITGITCIISVKIFLNMKLIYNTGNTFMKDKYKTVKEKVLYIWDHKISIMLHVRKSIFSQYDTRMINTVFALYTHWYKVNAQEIQETRAFPKDEFPDGAYELTKVYLYITEIRSQNERALNSLDFTSKGFLTLMKISFKRASFHINKTHQLHITGMNDLNPRFDFDECQSFEKKIISSLYNLDTEIATWIIRNRKHFGF
jgi:ABC-type multidrug transport system fused ATPase/permease subunit